MNEQNKELELAFNFVRFTDKHIFLTGKAGTGKTTFLHKLKSEGLKRMVVVAPTGVAAINAQGVTIHSFFQMPFGPIIPGTAGLPVKTAEDKGKNFYRKFNKEKIMLIKSMDLLVIDEISMVRADLLDGIDGVLRRYRDKNKAFGGVQVLMIGDLQQLAPVVKEDEWRLLRDYYETPFFFSSKVLSQTDYVSITLEKVYRQRDEEFIEILNKVRKNRADNETVTELNKRYIRGFSPDNEEAYIILTTHNAKAQKINNEKLRLLHTKSRFMHGTVSGDFPEHTWPTDLELELKKGAQVMFVKNDPGPEKAYYNGKIGIIDEIEEDRIFVRCPEEDELIVVTKVEWQNMKYAIDEESNQITETITGVFEQYPLKLAWAITIHKSQGLTFDKAIIDAAAAFAHGQVYVALSRCRTLDGLVLTSPLSPGCFINDRSIHSFTNNVNNHPPGRETFLKCRKIYQLQLLKELFNFRQMAFEIDQFHRLIDAHKNSLGGEPLDDLSRIKNNFDQEIMNIAERFLPRLGRMAHETDNVEENEKLQERLMKASAYFTEKLNDHVFVKLQQLTIRTDNKEVKKVIDESKEKIYSDCWIKLSCMRSCLNGFNTLQYLKAKSKSSIETPPKPAWQQKNADKNVINPELYKALNEWRNKKSGKFNVSAYVILPSKTITEICKYLPVTKKELRAVKGIGKQKIKEYGNEILSIINEFVSKYDMSKSGDKKKTNKKKNTRNVSLEMFRSGLSIEEIAEQRNFATGTIEGHLAQKIAEGELELDQVLNNEKATAILEIFHKHPSANLTAAKELLGDEFSYNEIRYVQKHIQHQEAKKQRD